MSFQRIKIAAAIGRYASSRRYAAVLRQIIIDSITTKQIDVVELDFVDVEVVSHAFSDGLLGVLAATYGKDWLGQHIRITNADPDDLAEIRGAIAARTTAKHSS